MGLDDGLLDAQELETGLKELAAMQQEAAE